MATRSIAARIEKLEARSAAAAQAQKSKAAEAEQARRIAECFERLDRESAEYEAMSTDEKIAALQTELAELPADSFLADYQRRCLEVDIMELQGAAPELIALARDQVVAAVRFRRPMPPIPTTTEEAPQELRLAQQEGVGPADDDGADPKVWPGEGVVVNAPSRTALAALDYSRQRDRLAEYRHQGRRATEPDHV